MKKIRISAMVLALILLVSQTSTVYALGFDDLMGQMYNKSTSGMPQKADLPDAFSIGFEYEEDGKYRTVLLEKDMNGNYHYVCGDEEYLFIQEGKGYKIGIKTVSGFVLKSNDKYSWEKIKQLTAQWWEFAEPLDAYGMGTVTEEGTGNICGRKTNKYKVDMGFGYNYGGYSMSMSESTYYEFDAETGICLSSSTNESVSFYGMDVGDGLKSIFECVVFATEKIELPTLV